MQEALDRKGCQFECFSIEDAERHLCMKSGVDNQLEEVKDGRYDPSHHNHKVTWGNYQVEVKRYVTKHFDKNRKAQNRHTTKKLTRAEEEALTDEQRQARQIQNEALRKVRKAKLALWLKELLK